MFIFPRKENFLAYNNTKKFVSLRLEMCRKTLEKGWKSINRSWKTTRGEEASKCHETSLSAQSKKNIIDFVCNFSMLRRVVVAASNSYSSCSRIQFCLHFDSSPLSQVIFFLCVDAYEKLRGLNVARHKSQPERKSTNNLKFRFLFSLNLPLVVSVWGRSTFVVGWEKTVKSGFIFTASFMSRVGDSFFCNFHFAEHRCLWKAFFFHIKIFFCCF